MKITLFIPCFVDQLFPRVGVSAVRIFEKLGHTVDFKEALICCGQPAFNAGYWEESRGIARRVVELIGPPAETTSTPASAEITFTSGKPPSEALKTTLAGFGLVCISR